MKYLMLIIVLGWSVMPERTQTTLPGVSSGEVKERYTYLGAEGCATKCHNSEELGNQYSKWKSTRHSESYKSLLSNKALEYAREASIAENPWESMACIKCHVTAAGFDTASYGPGYRKEDGVTCEACHKGEFNPKTFIPGEDICLKCHNDSAHEVLPFDFQERCRTISHPKPKTNQEQRSAN